MIRPTGRALELIMPETHFDLARTGRQTICAWALAILLSAGLGCTPDQANTVPAPRKITLAEQLDKILTQIRSSDPATRSIGNTALAEFQVPDDNGMPLALAMRLVRAAADPEICAYDAADDSGACRELLVTASYCENPKLFPLAVELFPQFPENARGEAQYLILQSETRACVRAWLQLVRDHGRAGVMTSLSTWRLAEVRNHAEIVFPELLEYCDLPELSSDIYLLCLDDLDNNLFEPDVLRPYAERIAADALAWNAQAREFQQTSGTAWLWSEEYETVRHECGVMLDLLRYVPGKSALKPLREALTFSDPRLLHFAATSLLARGEDVDAAVLETIAASPEMRAWLHRQLKEQGQLALFPQKYLTQEALAESELVDWLIFPTELGMAPDEIELMKVVPVDTGEPGGIYDYYVFRFRHPEATNGWMAGVAGSFLRSDEPTADANGDTWSSFESWDSKTPEEHVGDMGELLAKARERWEADKARDK